MIQFQQSIDTFFVQERLAYLLDGEGDHRWLLVRKKGMSTQEAKRRVSEMTGAPLRVIGHGGLKDKAATTEQWLSYPATAARQEPHDIEGLSIVDDQRHANGIQIGHVRSNRFRLLLDIEGEAPERDWSAAFPNFYGRQRISEALTTEEVKARIAKPSRDKFAISMLQSWLFNAFLRARLEPEFALEADEWWSSTNGKTHFKAEYDEELQGRHQRGEAMPTGPIFGYKGKFRPSEFQFLTAQGLMPDAFRPWGKIARGARRVLQVVPQNATAELVDGKLQLSFELPSGAYATVYLLSLFKPELMMQTPDTWPDFLEPQTLL